MRRAGWTGSEVWLLALVLIGYGYFDNGHNWNHISRFDAIFSFVEPGTADRFTFQIDHFLASPRLGSNTGDWARNPAHDEHYYSNKAPGPILLGVPAYAALYYTEALFGATPESTHWTGVNTWLLNVLLTIVPAGFAAVFFRRLLRSRIGLDATAATGVTWVLFFCTCLFPYATQFWGHVSAASFSIISLYFLCERGRAADLCSGLFVGLAVLSDYGSSITMLSFALLLLIEGRRASALRFSLGGLPALGAYTLYHQTAFGSWLSPATVFNNPRFSHSGGDFGFQADALFGLTASPEHGLFWFMPVLLLALPGIFIASSAAATPLRRLAMFNVAGFALMNVLFSGWHGGGCLGPRYLIPSLPFWVLLLAPLAGALHRRGPLATIGAIVAVVTAGVSGTNMALLALRSPSVSRAESKAAVGEMGLLGDSYSRLIAGELAPPVLSPIRLGGSWLVDGRVVSAKQGFVASNPATRPAANVSASSWIHRTRAGRTRLLIGWQGTLRLTAAGDDLELGRHDSFATREITVSLQAGDSKLEVFPAPDTPNDVGFSLVALSGNGSPLVPRPSQSEPVERAAGSSLGRQLGLRTPASTLLFGVGLASLTAGLGFAVRREAQIESRDES